MRRYELTFDSANCEHYTKPITALVLEPDHIREHTGAMLFTHGAAGNRLQTLPHTVHTEPLATRLKELGKRVDVTYYKNGTHSLAPTTTRLDAFKAMASGPMRDCVNTDEDDFLAGRTMTIPCADRILKIDWSKRQDDVGLCSWD